jgi:hypothetical protein
MLEALGARSEKKTEPIKLHSATSFSCASMDASGRVGVGASRLVKYLSAASGNLQEYM